ncbi:MAG: RNA-binding S4 domain-containing protein [Pseudomonadota bacterium]|nr:RNA-binding S4 domain-containing protein [Pseudomonadota bacterium]
MTAETGAPSLRLDKWLWYARFFKTRALATRAIAGGRFRLDGEVMSKPHRAAQPGQVLTFMQQDRVRVIRIVELGSRRGPATEAVTLYEDLSPEMPKRETGTAEPLFESRERGAGRPTKRDRRAIQNLKSDIG